LKQRFVGPVTHVAGRDVNNHYYYADAAWRGNAGGRPIADKRDGLANASAEECSRVHNQLVAVRAQLWQMLLRHPTIVPYLLAWIGLGVLIAAFWGEIQPYPHGVIFLGWGLLVIGPAGWVMARPREPMYEELLDVRRQLIRAERRLVRLEAERRAAIAQPDAPGSTEGKRDGTEVPELRRPAEEGAST